MDICIVGAGYVGLTTAVLLAELGHNVHCIDKDIDKIEKLNQGICPIHEPELEDLIKKNTKNGRLIFSDDREACMLHSPTILIAVGTPPKPNGDSDLTAFKKVFQHISQKISTHKTIIIKSTVPPGTNEWAHNYLIEKGVDQNLFDVVSNPEFLREGSAIYDSFHPDKIVIGSRSAKARKRVKELYAQLSAPVIETTLAGAEMMKYASNAFLATKISFINEFARVCDKYHVDVTDVASSLGIDPRIGPHFLQSGLGYGGSCFPKDLDALCYAARKKRISTQLLKAVKQVNSEQVDYYIRKLEKKLRGLEGKRISVWGLSFKPNTDDIRDSQSIKLCEKLIKSGCSVFAFDPEAHAENLFIHQTNDMYDALSGSDALIVATDWALFKSPDWERVRNELKGRIVLDGRNFLDPEEVKHAGLTYLGVGRA
ncbi:UDP-glucose dehydrogenase family protein [Alkalihalobacillus sp. CinArs1]|uniref:UDP-glucose dehydrogenase family protein n=1 Tax=Alkalihalobacillus sp. CinArs1 TaxID=2995314 RepID=UPI0022DD748A|nr:UDP-glucose/GDP-mannose dehydrogenase family protein [Alkalihalobacillus sp. CinArs1]